jgi:hypothetical protein
MEWAIDLMTRMSASMASSFRLRVSDSPIEKTKKRVLQVIAGSGKLGISTRDLTRKTQFLKDRRDRDTVLTELESSGLVSSVNENRGGKSVKKWLISK